MLGNLDAILDKGQAWAREKEVEPAVLLQPRLVPDMLPLVRQVQIATDMAKNGCARLAGEQPPAFPDEEATFEELHARIARALEYVRGFDAARLADSATRSITVPSRTYGEMTFDGRGYLLGFVLPNLYFHVTTAYAILRQAGVGLGKRDFMGAPPR